MEEKKKPIIPSNIPITRVRLPPPIPRILPPPLPTTAPPPLPTTAPPPLPTTAPPLPVNLPADLPRRASLPPTNPNIEIISNLIRNYPHTNNRATNAALLVNYLYKRTDPIKPKSTTEYKINLYTINTMQKVLTNVYDHLSHLKTPDEKEENKFNDKYPNLEHINLFDYINSFNPKNSNLLNKIRGYAITLRELIISKPKLKIKFTKNEHLKDLLSMNGAVLQQYLEKAMEILNDDELWYNYYKEELEAGNYHAYASLFNNKYLDEFDLEVSLMYYNNEVDTLHNLFIRAIQPYKRLLYTTPEAPDLDVTGLSHNQIIEAMKALYPDHIFSMLVIRAAVQPLEPIGPERTIFFPLTQELSGNPELVGIELMSGMDRLKMIVDDPVSDREHNYSSSSWGMTFCRTNRFYVDIVSLDNKAYIPETKQWVPPVDRNVGRFEKLFTGNLNLTHLQIYRECDLKNIDHEQCFIHALRQSGKVSDEHLHHIMLAYPNGSHMNISCYKKIAEEIYANIIIRFFDKFDVNNPNKERRMRIQSYGDEYTHNVIELGMYDGHVFVDKKHDTCCTRYYINNYNDIDHTDHSAVHYTRFREGRYEYSEPTYYRTVDLIKRLDDLGLFVRSQLLDDASVSEYKQPEKIILTEATVNSNQEEFIYNEAERKKGKRSAIYGMPSTFSADLEADTAGCHKPILAGLIHIMQDIKANELAGKYSVFYDGNVIKSMLNKIAHLTKESKHKWAIVYFHNLKYDIALMIRQLFVTKHLVKDNQLYFVGLQHNGVYIEFRDFAKIVNSPLRDFNKTFGLPKHLNKKEAIAYDYYKLENRPNHNTKPADRLVDVDYYKSFLKTDKEKVIFEENLAHSLDCRGEYNDSYGVFRYNRLTETFDPWAYYLYYLKYDCLVLSNGIIQIRDILASDDIQIDLYDFYTISSIAFEAALKMGAFDGVYKVSGVLRQFINLAVNGGRNHIGTKYKGLTLDENVLDLKNEKVYTDSTAYEGITDLDGVSLYPSAMGRLSKECGFPLGRAKLINTFEPEEYNDYVIEINIAGIGKEQAMPMICHRKPDGSLDYINKIPDGGLVVVVDKTTLEDYIEYHKIIYQFRRGVYWDDGYECEEERTIGAVIDKLFKLRAAAKKEKQIIDGKEVVVANEGKRTLYKLMMNSIYGKTITKINNIECKIVQKTTVNRTTGERDPDNWKKELYKDYHRIIDFEEITNNCYSVRLYKYDSSGNFAHIGAKILSYSKRIMNEVFGVANDNNIPLFYTDTDSMHMLKSQLKLLRSKFAEKYNGRELLDDNKLGHFHVDFKLKKHDGTDINSDDVIAIRSIFVDKKVYCNELVGRYIDENGVMQTVHGYHYRFKGVSNAALEYACNKDFGGDFIAMYEYLATPNREKYVFDMRAGGIKALFTNDLFVSVRTDLDTRRYKYA
jgi:hypothetical protein